MPLTRLVVDLPDINHSQPEVMVNRPGFLFVQMCDTWVGPEKDADNTATLVAVYRSPLVKPTSRAYRPVADMLLNAEVLEQLVEEQDLEDPHMMHGSGKLSIYRLSTKARATQYMVEEVQEAMYVTHRIFKEMSTR